MVTRDIYENLPILYDINLSPISWSSYVCDYVNKYRLFGVDFKQQKEHILTINTSWGLESLCPYSVIFVKMCIYNSSNSLDFKNMVE